MKIKVLLIDWYGVMDSFDSKMLFKLIPKLKPNYKIGVLSNMSISGKTYLCSLKNVCSSFDYFFVSSEIGYHKPDKKIYLEVLKQIQFQPFEVVFIDDNYKNIEAAKKVGMIGIHFQSYEQLHHDLDKIGIKYS